LTFVRIGPHTEFNVFEVDGNTGAHPADADVRARPPGPLRRLQAASIENFEEIRQRLMDGGAADDFVTDFGPLLSIFFRDPDRLECEVCVANPDAVPGVNNPPGTRAARYPARTDPAPLWFASDGLTTAARVRLRNTSSATVKTISASTARRNPNQPMAPIQPTLLLAFCASVPLLPTADSAKSATAATIRTV
jgi:hypothetical protein